MAQLNVLKGKDLTAVMDYIELDGIPYPAMPPAARVLAHAGEVRHSRRDPDGDPEHPRHPQSHRAASRMQQGTDFAYVTAAGATTAGYVFYLDPGPAPGTSIAYWGPEIKRRPAAAGAERRTWTHIPTWSRSPSTSTRVAEMPIVFIQEPNSKAPIPIPIPTSRRSTRRSAWCRRCPEAGARARHGQADAPRP
jgi:hypothetical protein